MTAIGIVVAMRWEAATLGPLQPAARVAIAGPGPDRATVAARGLADAGAGALLSWGAAAGIDPALDTGALLLPAAVIDRDGAALAAASRWHRAVAARLPEAATAPLAAADRVLADAPAKRALHARTGAVAADMESAAVVRAAAAAGRPALVLRAILDPAAAGVPGPWAGTVGAHGRVDPGALVRALLAPRLWPAGVRLGRQRARAARALRAAAARAGDPLRGGAAA